MDSETLTTITQILVGTFILGLLTFAFLYFYYSNWRKTTVGPYILLTWLTMAFTFVYILVAPMMLSREVRAYVNVLVAMMLNYGAWRMAFLLIQIQRGKDKEDENT